MVKRAKKLLGEFLNHSLRNKMARDALKLDLKKWILFWTNPTNTYSIMEICIYRLSSLQDQRN